MVISTPDVCRAREANKPGTGGLDLAGGGGGGVSQIGLPKGAEKIEMVHVVCLSSCAIGASKRIIDALL